MFPLANLPPELLAQILRGPLSAYAVRLWKCGNSALNLKLALGMREMELDQISHHAQRFIPLILPQFSRLRSLHVSTSHTVARQDADTPILLESLPETLESLAFLCLSNHTVFLRPVSAETGFVSPKSQYPLGESRFVNIQRLTRLHTLRIESRYGHSLSSSPILSCDLPGLPPHLTSLNIQVQHYYDQTYAPHSSNRFMSILPRTLRVFEGLILAHCSTPQDEPLLRADWAEAPPHLEVLRGLVWPTEPDTADWLPKSLTIVEGAQGSTWPEWTPKMSASWPPLVKSILVRPSPSQDTWDLALPSKLENFDCELLAPTLKLHPSHLPRSITNLRVKGLDVAYIKQLSDSAQGDRLDWPPGLTSFSLHNAIQWPKFAHAFYNYLPTTLKTLRYTLSPATLETDVSTLPSQLETLVLTAVCSLNIEGQFPSSITNLQLIAHYQSTIQLEHSTFKALPRGLRHLQASLSRSITASDPAVNLPKQLQTLNMLHWQCEWISSIPHSVTNLELRHLAGTRTAQKYLDGTLLQHLPSGLTRLHLAQPFENQENFPPLQKGLIETTPNLTDLHLDIGHLPSAFLRHIPRGLLQLSITLETIEEVDAPFIPPNLLNIFLGYKIDKNKAAYDFLGLYWPLKSRRLPPAGREVFETRMRQLSW